MPELNATSRPVTQSTDFNKSVLSKGEEILRRMEGQSKVSLFSKDFWYGSVMEWSMKNEKFKTNMFRFVDVLPSLNSGGEVARHLKEYFAENGEELPSVFNMGLGLGSLAPGLMAGAIRKNVTSMAKMFITGETPDESLPVLKKARKNKMTFTVDILGEATLSEKEAHSYQSRYIELINWLAKDAAHWENIPQIDEDDQGAIPKVNVSVKLTALYSQINDRSWDETKRILKERLRPIYDLAMEKNVFLNLDMEQYSVKDLTLEVFTELLAEPKYATYPFFGCVVQAYLRDSFSDIQKLTDFARRRKTPFTIRLVKGAYWDYETIEAEQRGWPIPVYTVKAESDANYERCAHYLLDNYPVIKAALASHNVRTLASALVYAEQKGLSPKAFEIQMLYGMAEPIKKTLVDMGYRLREYAPVGELIPGMAYLVRRLLENTSNESWLRGKFADSKSSQELLKDPSAHLQPTSAEVPKQPGRFYNEPLLDFAVAENRQKIEAAIKAFKLAQKIDPVIAGQKVQGGTRFQRTNPSDRSQVVADIGWATAAQANQAVESAHKAWKTWRKVPAEKRAELVDKLADTFARDRFALIVEQVYEVGKPWAEADGDIGEAIDFCRYYARHMREIAKPLRVGHAPGEVSQYIYKSRGVTAVIAPWNFPLAILTGQVVAAMVTGNTVVMKPAEQSTLIAWGLFQRMLEVGFPMDAIHFLPGKGEEVGAALVDHPHVTTIAFTGSKAVGLEILNKASVRRPGQNEVKRCIIEMGGKNAVIIDNDADLDEAVDGVLYSAFGFSGQKCSAASRCIVLDEVYDRFVDRLVEGAKSLKVGSSLDGGVYTGPVVDEESQQRILRTIETASGKHRVLFKGEAPQNGCFVPLTIIDQVKKDDDLAQKEVFGPVLAVIKAKDLDEALEIANSTEYALTGGIFSRSPANIEQVRHEFECGNLYINRGITGAMVDRHPFGGYKMSGIGSKTGGPDYLKQFMEPICVTENTLRRGFAPAEEQGLTE